MPKATCRTRPEHPPETAQHNSMTVRVERLQLKNALPLFNRNYETRAHLVSVFWALAPELHETVQTLHHLDGFVVIEQHQSLVKGPSPRRARVPRPHLHVAALRTMAAGDALLVRRTAHRQSELATVQHQEHHIDTTPHTQHPCTHVPYRHVNTYQNKRVKNHKHRFRGTEYRPGSR